MNKKYYVLFCIFSAFSAGFSESSGDTYYKLPGLIGNKLYGVDQNPVAQAFLYEFGLIERKNLTLVADIFWTEPLNELNNEFNMREMLQEQYSQDQYQQIGLDPSSLLSSNRTSVGKVDVYNQKKISRGFAKNSVNTQASPEPYFEQHVKDDLKLSVFKTNDYLSHQEDENGVISRSFSPNPQDPEDAALLRQIHSDEEKRLSFNLKERAAESQRGIIADARAFVEYVRNEVQSRSQSLASSVIHSLRVSQAPFTNDLHDSLENTREEILANVQHLLSHTNGVNTSKSNSPRQSSANNQEISQEMAGPHNSLSSVHNVQQDDAVADSNALVVQNNKKRDLASNKKTTQQTAISSMFLDREKAEESMLHQPNAKAKLRKGVAFSFPMQNVRSTFFADQNSGSIQVQNDTPQVTRSLLTVFNQPNLIENSIDSYQSSENDQFAEGSNVYGLSTNAEPLGLKNNELRLEDVQERLVNEHVNSVSNNTSREASPGPVLPPLSRPSLYISNTASPAIQHSTSVQRAERKASLQARGERLIQKQAAARRRIPSEEVDRLIEKLTEQSVREQAAQRVIDTVRAQGGRANDCDYTISPFPSPSRGDANEDVELHDFKQLKNFVAQHSAHSSLSRDSLSSPKITQELIENLRKEGKIVLDLSPEKVAGDVSSPEPELPQSPPRPFEVADFMKRAPEFFINRTMRVKSAADASQILLRFADQYMKNKCISELIFPGGSLPVHYQYDPSGTSKGLAKKSFKIISQNNLPFASDGSVVYRFASENLQGLEVGMIFDDIISWRFHEAVDTAKWKDADWGNYFFNPERAVPKMMQWKTVKKDDMQKCFQVPINQSQIALAFAVEIYTYGDNARVVNGSIQFSSNKKFLTSKIENGCFSGVTMSERQNVFFVPANISSYSLAQYVESNLEKSVEKTGVFKQVTEPRKLVVIYFHPIPVNVIDWNNYVEAWQGDLKISLEQQEFAKAQKEANLKFLKEWYDSIVSRLEKDIQNVDVKAELASPLYTNHYNMALKELEKNKLVGKKTLSEKQQAECVQEANNKVRKYAIGTVAARMRDQAIAAGINFFTNAKGQKIMMEDDAALKVKARADIDRRIANGEFSFPVNEFLKKVARKDNMTGGEQPSVPRSHASTTSFTKNTSQAE